MKMLYPLISTHLPQEHEETVYWTLMIVGTLIVACLSFWLYDHIIIFSTSLSGSFCALFAIGLLAGNFPNYDDIYYQIKAG